MAALPRTIITSFVIRFVVTTTGDSPTDQPVYHGMIRHIQSDEELNFSSWKEAESFIRRFIPIEETYK